MDGNLKKASLWLPLGAAFCVSFGVLKTTPSAAVESKITPEVVSLAPSNTELLIDVGARSSIVGVCTNCAEVLPNANQLKDVPVAGTFVSANLERLTRLKPSVVLLVSGQEAIASLLKRHNFKIAMLRNDKLADVPKNLRTIGNLSGKEKQAEEVARKFDAALNQLTATVASTKAKPKVFYCTWAQPLLTVGKTSFLNDVITTCGGVNIAGNIGQPYPHFSAEHLILADPDVIILPYNAKDQHLFKRFPWNKLRAVKENHLYYSPDPKEDSLSRPSFRVLEGLHWLTIKLHPQLKEKLDIWRNNVRLNLAKY